MSKSIVLITSGQPSANPRLTKEAIALAKSGYHTTVVYCPLSPWADKFDEQLFRNYPEINWVAAGYHPTKHPWLFKFSRLRKKIYLFAYRFSLFRSFPERAIALFTQELYKVARKFPAQLYIGHNLGALPVVIKLAKNHGAKAGFDAEDHHSSEVREGSIYQRLNADCELRYFRQLNYLTTSSPLISEKYKAQYGLIDPPTIINAFSKSYLQKQTVPYQETDRLKLFWFSQTVGKERGLEEVIEAIGICNKQFGNISCTLLGNCSGEMKTYLINLASIDGVRAEQLIFSPAVELAEIFSIAGQHHVGLALEVVSNANREICITNKILTYPVAGLAIIATDTIAQKRLLDKYQGMGFYYKQGNADSLAELILNYALNPILLTANREKALFYASTELNWEKVEGKFLSTVQELF